VTERSADKDHHESQDEREVAATEQGEATETEALASAEPDDLDLPAEAEEELADLQASEDPEALQANLEEALAKADEYLDGWQRARAELANYRRRVEREREDQYARTVAAIVFRYLDVMDDLERALKDRPASEETASWAEGIEMIYKKMQTILEAEGVERIEAEGECFDPRYHEAVSLEPSEDHEEGEVIGVLQEGYKIGERVVRPAMVRVAK
jgi:molecular chaperone GrpE